MRNRNARRGLKSQRLVRALVIFFRSRYGGKNNKVGRRGVILSVGGCGKVLKSTLIQSR